MSEIAGITIRPPQAGGAESASAPTSVTELDHASSFGATLKRAVQNAVEIGQQADEKSIQALTTGTGLTDVVMALSHAELTLQTASAIRDRVIQAYQDIIKMPI